MIDILVVHLINWIDQRKKVLFLRSIYFKRSSKWIQKWRVFCVESFMFCKNSFEFHLSKNSIESDDVETFSFHCLFVCLRTIELAESWNMRNGSILRFLKCIRRYWRTSNNIEHIHSERAIVDNRRCTSCRWIHTLSSTLVHHIHLLSYCQISKDMILWFLWLFGFLHTLNKYNRMNVLICRYTLYV